MAENSREKFQGIIMDDVGASEPMTAEQKESISKFYNEAMESDNPPYVKTFAFAEEVGCTSTVGLPDKGTIIIGGLDLGNHPGKTEHARKVDMYAEGYKNGRRTGRCQVSGLVLALAIIAAAVVGKGWV